MRCSAKTRVSSFGIVTLFLLLGACATKVPEVPELFREATAEELVQLLEARASAIQSMKGLFKVQVKGPGLSFAKRVQAAIYYQRPQALRLQGFTPFGGELFEFVLNEGRYRLRIASNGQRYAGPVSELDRSQDISRPFRLSLLAMTCVVGIAPVPPGVQVKLIEEGARYRLDVYSSTTGADGGEPKPARRIWFERRTLQTTQEERLTSSGEVDAKVQCEDFRPLPAAAEESAQGGTVPAPNSLVRPFKVTAEDAQGEGALVMTFEEMIPNPALTPKELGIEIVGAVS